MSKLNICIIGLGRVAERHAKTITKLGMNLYVASRDAQKAERFSKKCNAQGFFGSYEFAAQSSEIDALVICTPPDQHLDGVKLAVKHKKHVLVEKPFALSLQQADEAIEIAQKAGITLMVAENYYFLPALKKAKQLIEQGAIGKLRFIQLSHYKKKVVTGWRAKGTGVFMDMGTHFATVVRSLGGKVKSIYAMYMPQTLPIEGEDSIAVIARLENGVVAEINVSWMVHFPKKLNTWVIAGTDGTILIESLGTYIVVWGRNKRMHFTDLKNDPGYTPMMQEFIDAIQQQREPRYSPEEAKKDLAFVLASYQSARAKK